RPPREARRGLGLEITPREVGRDALLVLAQGVAPGLVRVPEGLWLRNPPALEHPAVPLVGRPRPMGGLVVAHEEERTVLWPAPDELDREVGDEVGGVAAGVGLLARGRVEHRIVGGALAGNDLPAVEPGGVAPEV